MGYAVDVVMGGIRKSVKTGGIQWGGLPLVRNICGNGDLVMGPNIGPRNSGSIPVGGGELPTDP